VWRLIKEVTAYDGENVFPHPLKSTLDFRPILRRNFHLSHLGDCPSFRLSMMYCAEGDHPSGVVVMVLGPGRIKVVVFEIRIPASTDRTPPTNFAPKLASYSSGWSSGWLVK
jgi:hypothetical protein